MLQDKAEKMIKEVETLRNDCMREIFDYTTVKNLGMKEVALIQTALKVLDSTLELAEETAKSNDEQNRKLDKILSLMEKGSN